jgi:hypothetical protein
MTEQELEVIEKHAHDGWAKEEFRCRWCLENQAALIAEVERLRAFPRYWAFSVAEYSSGGDADLVGRFATVAEARAALIANGYNDDRWVVDVTTGEKVHDVEWDAKPAGAVS